MAYNKPELLLVGAAQNLVLTNSLIDNGVDCTDPDGAGPAPFVDYHEW